MGDPAQTLLAYRACLAAVWSDQSMTPAERTQLSALIESLAEGEEERALLRRETLREVDPEAVFADLARLDAAARRAAFERCLAILAADRLLASPDLRFLGRLRRACGLGAVEYELRLWSLWWRDGVRIFHWKTMAAGALVGLVGIGV
ncbi:MAG: hypothetical protein KGL53_03955, partial [Elusimicrobia bacterium]|nr:hypothetical protein [Elusimicrobiota bacterium]